MTYFVEYFLELLSRAVDERRLRIQNAENEVRQAEIEMARTALSPPSHTGPPGNMTAKDSASVKEPEVTPNESQLREANEFPDGFRTVSANEPEQSFDDSDSGNISLGRIRDRLYDMVNGRGKTSKKCAMVLIDLFDDGIYSFTSNDIAKRCDVSRKMISVFIGHLREKNLIENNGQEGGYTLYQFRTDITPLLPDDYSPETLKAVKELMDSKFSKKDNRIGNLIFSCLPKGMITASDYEQFGDVAKMSVDMELPVRAGIVEKVNKDTYKINKAINSGFYEPSITEKNFLTDIYLSFQHEWFTCTSFTELTNRSKSRAADILHRLSLQRILECKKEKMYQYRLLVSPETHPILFADPVKEETAPIAEQNDTDYSDDVYELIDTLATSEFSTRDRRLGTVMQQCLEKGTLFRSDYDDWGYTENMWSIDTELAVLLGLISKESSDCYSLNKELCPELRPTQKKTLTAIYEAFGCDEFSSDMFIATLNYSVSYTYASLHKLTLLRLLDQNIDENGNRYRLVVTPEDNPECFEPAA